MKDKKKESTILNGSKEEVAAIESKEKGGKSLAVMRNKEGLTALTITTLIPLIESLRDGRTTIVGGDPEFHKDAEGSIEMVHLRSTDINPDDLDEEDYEYLNKWLTICHYSGNRVVGFLERSDNTGIAKGFYQGGMGALNFFRPKEGLTVDEAVAEIKGQHEVTTDEHGNEWVTASLEEIMA